MTSINELVWGPVSTAKVNNQNIAHQTEMMRIQQLLENRRSTV